jgi:thiol-disulfide isomerase/thioredoxin
LEKSINKIWLKARHDKITKSRDSCKNEVGFWMNGCNNNNVDTLLVLIIVALTLIADPTIICLTSSHNAKAAQFGIDKSQFKKAPEFTGTTGYLNTPSPVKLADLKGKVVLVHFWTYTCINCIHTIPYLNELYQKYSNKGLIIVGVQTPEFDFEKNMDNVKAAVQNFQIQYPVILDNNYVNWNAYGNNYWPRDYLVDDQGLIRYNHIGEGGYAQTEQMIKSLLAEGAIS